MDMKKLQFEYLEHTADLKVRAKGKTLEEAFVNVALGGFNFLTDISKVNASSQKEIDIKSKSMEALLYDFLEELLFLLDTEGFLFSGAEKFHISESDGAFALSCKALGDAYKNYEMKGDIKAITYSDMNIAKADKEWVITVVFDI